MGPISDRKRTELGACHAENMQAEADLAMDSGMDAGAVAPSNADGVPDASPKPQAPTPGVDTSLPSVVEKANESDGELLAVKTGAPVVEMVAQVCVD